MNVLLNRLQGAKGDDYKASSDIWKEVAENFDEASRGEQVGNSYSSPGRIDRRGVGTVPTRGRLLEQMNGGYKIGGQQVGSAYAWSEPLKSPEVYAKSRNKDSHRVLE